jgi:hypothetical protein
MRRSLCTLGDIRRDLRVLLQVKKADEVGRKLDNSSKVAADVPYPGDASDQRCSYFV